MVDFDLQSNFREWPPPIKQPLIQNTKIFPVKALQLEPLVKDYLL